MNIPSLARMLNAPDVHQRDAGLKLEWETKDKTRYTIVQQMDICTGIAYNYSVRSSPP
ncbi:hypothetical protein R1A30_06385 [Paenibacillus larvae]|nr:hypothetical protein [Paenibacillus larvae]